MSKTAIIYWSSTGNTQAMAEAVHAGALKAGSEAELFSAGEFSGNIADYDGIALGCPAMGAEVLEEAEFQPFFDSIAGELAGKKVALFGSYGWGDGQWMRDWEETCGGFGITLAHESVICNSAPDDSALSECEALGEAIA